MALLSDGTAKVHRSILVELWCFTSDQLHPCLGIFVASCLEVVAALWREEAEEVLSTAFWVFEITDGVEVIETDLFKKTLLGGRFVEREEIGPKDKVEWFPLLRTGALVVCMPWNKMG